MNSSTLRILDANANRAREALRVIEDYARFVLDDEVLCAALKQLRHDFTDSTQPLVGFAILHRNTPADVGTSIKTSAELARDDVEHVVTAAGKRLGEALRTIEEYLKIQSQDDAGKIEKIRYQFYDLEQQIARTLRPNARFADVKLYVLITESACKLPWYEVAEQAILGGADCLQLREKDHEGIELLARARLLVELCHRHGVLCIINDRVDVGLLSNADGVHLGQQDLPPREARKLFGENKIVGVSTHNIEQAKAAVRDGADYIGVGPFFKSPTKPRDFLAGPQYAKQAAEQIKIPAVAIAGITEANVDEVLATGIHAIAVTAAITASDDPRASTERLKKNLNRPQMNTDKHR